jgi:hypothetical protein
MDNNMYQGISADDTPTAPYRLPGAAPGGPGGTGPGPRPGKGTARATWSRGKRAAALLAVCAVVGGGAFAVVEATSGSPAATPAADVQAGTPASLTAQATALQEAIAAPGIRRLARLRRLGGMYGQFTFQTKKGPQTLAFERGTITSAGGGDVMVRAADGTTYEWAVTSTSVVRENGQKEPQSALAPGQAVLAAGPLANGARDARLIVIKKAGASPKPSGTS